MTRKSKVKYPRYHNYVRSFYREGFDGFIPNVKDKPFNKLYPDVCAWQFPDMELIDYVYDHIINLKETDELEKGHCTHNGEKGQFAEVKDSFDLSHHVDNAAFTHDSVREFDIACKTFYNWLNFCSLDYSTRNPSVANEPYAIEHSTIQYQYYESGGGFKIQHHERSMAVQGDFTSQQRELVYMIYLNDVEDGGTHFVQKGTTMPARKGLTVVFPAGHEFQHVGQISHTKEKMIITGWFVTHPR